MGQHPAEFLTGHMALIELQNISKSYDGELVLDEFDLKIKENEFITLLGPSGCGKTTTLRIIGGFETPDKGQVLFDGKDITALPPNELRSQYCIPEIRPFSAYVHRGKYRFRT